MEVASATSSVLLNSQAVQANSNAGNPDRAKDANSAQANNAQANQPDNDGDSDDRGRGTNINLII